MATVCRYMVVRVDASLATCASAEENCSQATTTVNPSRAPKTSETQVKNGDSTTLFSGLTDSGRRRSASQMLPTAARIDTATAPAREIQRPTVHLSDRAGPATVAGLKNLAPAHRRCLIDLRTRSILETDADSEAKAGVVRLPRKLFKLNSANFSAGR